jgi:hypothetical protein
MRYLFIVFLLSGCFDKIPELYAVVDGEVLRNDTIGGYMCEFGVLRYVGGSKPILNIHGEPIACEKRRLTYEEYCSARKPAYDRGCK